MVIILIVYNIIELLVIVVFVSGWDGFSLVIVVVGISSRISSSNSYNSNINNI